MRIVEVNPAEHIDSVHALLRENWDETGFDFDLQPDAEAYRRAAAAGVLFALAAYDGDQVVGYSTAFVTPHHFNPSLIVAHTDALFVSKPYRAGTAGGRLLAETERVAKARGAHRICWHTRAGTTLADTLARRPGYTPVDVIVQKEL